MSRSTSASRAKPHYASQPSAEFAQPILPDAVGEDVTRIYDNLVSPLHEQDDTLFEPSDDEHDVEITKRQNLPWWKRPSSWWVVSAMPIAALVVSATIGPRVEIYTGLVCATHKPDIFKEAYPLIEQWKLGFDIGHEQPDPSPILPSKPVPPVLGDLPVITAVFAGNDTGSEPHRNPCATDPIVLAKTAQLNAALQTVMGILSCITTAWWGAYSDRRGRVRVMGIAITGLLLTDMNFILVTFAWRRLPGGYWFLLVTSVLEGIVGGLSTSVAAFHSYLADTTAPSSRNRVFSLAMGLFFIGMGVGPALGSLIIKFTGRTISVFYFASACHILFALATWTILPEPVTETRLVIAREKYNVALRQSAETRKSAGFWTKVGLTILQIFSFLGVLADVFSPKGLAKKGNPLKSKRDWNLPILAASYGSIVMLLGAYPYKFQYAALNFGWDSISFGYWLTLVAATRAIHLIVILPLLIRIFKPKPILLETFTGPDEQEPLLDSRRPAPRKTEIKEYYIPTFELTVSRVSIFLEVVAYTCITFILDPTWFTILSMLGSLSAGFGPSMQTVALHLHVTRTGSHTETGKLFGALSVIQALCSQIIGPALFGLVFAKSVVVGFSQAIFILATAFVSLAFLGLLSIRLRPAEEAGAVGSDEEEHQETDSLSGTHVQEDTLVDVSTQAPAT